MHSIKRKLWTAFRAYHNFKLNSIYFFCKMKDSGKPWTYAKKNYLIYLFTYSYPKVFKKSISTMHYWISSPVNYFRICFLATFIAMPSLQKEINISPKFIIYVRNREKWYFTLCIFVYTNDLDHWCNTFFEFLVFLVYSFQHKQL